MSNTQIKSVILFFAVIIVLSTPLNAARLAEGEYAVWNGSFENSDSFETAGWAAYLGNPQNTITINTDSTKSYYGKNSVKLYTDAVNTVIFQEINVVGPTEAGPKIGDSVEGGVWIMFDSEAANDVNGQVLLQVKYVVGSTPYVITSSADIQNKQANKWYYLLTDTNEVNGTRQIPAGAEKIQIVIDSRVLGTVYVDFAQCGKVGSITGNPSKLAMVEYQTWFGEPNYLPDWRRFTDANYAGFADYNNHHWKHWDWGWVPDEGYNSDPGLHKQIGIKAGRNFALLNSSFEEPNYGDANFPGWRRWSPTGGNIRTSEKACDGSYSIKYTNPVAGVNECAMWQWITCYDVAHPQDNAPNEKEMVYASVWVNFGDINDINLAGGNFWIQLRAHYDPDFNPDTNNNEWMLIAKSYEHVSPEYVRENATPSGWVQIKTRPVNKSVVPWWTHGLEVAVRFYYAGTVYIDKVEVGEAEYSNIERQIACAKTPLIGPYDSTSDDVIAYHLDVCKAMLFDAMLINYYGHQYGQEDYQRVAFQKIIEQSDDKDMKVCIFYEPKVHLKKWGDINYYSDMTDVSEMNAADTAKVNEYIDDVTEYNSVTEISDINLVKHYIKLAAIQEDIEHVLNTWSSGKSYLAYRGEPVIGIFGLYASKYDDNMVEQD